MDGLKVLIVDDEVDFIETMVNRLKKRKIDTTGVYSGEEALEAIRKGGFDIVIMDVKMPGGMDGIETLKEIKRIEPSVSVILLTGHASLETSIEGIELGACDYLLKPHNFEEMLKKIEECRAKRT